MNKENLSKKMNIILEELKMNRKEFLNECKKVNPYISKPTVLNLINGNSKGLPKLETIDTVINVCRLSGNEKLKSISYDYLMDEKIDNTTRANIDFGEDLHLSDNTIYKLKHSWKIVDPHIISDFVDFVPSSFWEYQSYIKNISNLQRLSVEAKENLNRINKDNVKALKELYCNYKRCELDRIKKTKSGEEYKEYLIKSFNYSDIYDKNYSIKELEDNLIEMYSSFLADLKENFDSFLDESKMNNNYYSNSDMEGFKNYLKEEYKNITNNEIEKFYNSVEKFSRSYISAYILEYLRSNFKSQHKFIKDSRKMYEKVLIYKENGIALFKEAIFESEKFLNEFYESLEIFNKYLRLLISESLIEYYNRIQSEELKFERAYKGLYPKDM